MIRLSLRKKICLILSAFTIVFSLLLMIAVGMGFTPFYFPEILLLVSYEQCW